MRIGLDPCPIIPFGFLYVVSWTVDPLAAMLESDDRAAPVTLRMGSRELGGNCVPRGLHAADQPHQAWLANFPAFMWKRDKG